MLAKRDDRDLGAMNVNGGTQSMMGSSIAGGTRSLFGDKSSAYNRSTLSPLKSYKKNYMGNVLNPYGYANARKPADLILKQ